MINTLEEIHHGLVHRRHNELKSAGKNPDLAALQCELRRRDGLHLSEPEIAELLVEPPLESGRHGFCTKSEKAHRASCRATNLSAEAIDELPESHAEASKAHAEAARAHRVAAIHHDNESERHEEIANPKTIVDQSQAVEKQPDENGAPLSCARALPSLLGDESATVPNVIMFMPGGVHRITPSRAGKPVTVVVEVNEATAEQLESQRKILAVGGNPPFFSLEHTSDIAAFWPTRFFWDTRRDATDKMAEGVWCDGEWTAAGLEAVAGKSYRTFSPVFFVDAVRNDEENPVHVICNPEAKLNMGGFLNDPAFSSLSPLWPAPATT